MKKAEIKIKTYSGKEFQSAVYVLSRGNKLSEVRAVAQILFLSERLKPHLRGSVIEFITVAAYRKQFFALWLAISPAVILQTAQALADLEQHAAAVQKQIRLLSQLRKSIAFAALV